MLLALASSNYSYASSFFILPSSFTLAPALGAVTALSMGKNIRTNEVEAVEIGSQIPGQMTIEEVTDSFDEREKTPRQVDPSTGEIIEQAEHSDNVIDLRARQA